MVTKQKFLKTHKTHIVCDGQKITLQGINLGGWLMMEGYILHSLNVAEHVFKREFQKILGEESLLQFEKAFRNNFIQESDVRQIADFGFNCIRLPFNHRLIEPSPCEYSKSGLSHIDKVIKWAKKYRIRVILDLHAACGSQNHDWHSDSSGRAELWLKKDYQKRTIALWEFLADTYKNEPIVAGYDILNEAVVEDTKLLNSFYKEVIRAVRNVDRNHILFIEGNRWATDIACLDRFEDDNYALSIHYYEPTEFTFNLVPQKHYPLQSSQGNFDKKIIEKVMQNHQTVSLRHNVPILLGEFGVNDRDGLYGEDRWLKDVLDCAAQFGFHWTYWTYKAIKNAAFPDGILSYRSNSAWVNRQGPQLGWNTYTGLWPKYQKQITQSWRTENFSLNNKVIAVLKETVEDKKKFENHENYEPCQSAG